MDTTGSESCPMAGLDIRDVESLIYTNGQSVCVFVCLSVYLCTCLLSIYFWFEKQIAEPLC